MKVPWSSENAWLLVFSVLPQPHVCDPRSHSGQLGATRCFGKMYRFPWFIIIALALYPKATKKSPRSNEVSFSISVATFGTHLTFGEWTFVSYHSAIVFHSDYQSDQKQEYKGKKNCLSRFSKTGSTK